MSIITIYRVETDIGYAEFSNEQEAIDCAQGAVYETIERALPSEEELVNQHNTIVSAEITQARAQAYRDEADPLFFKAQRGEIDQQVWLDKIEEIKQRYPKVGENNK